MRIQAVRRLSQAFFLLLLLWLCLVATPGEAFWQWSGWPLHALLGLDPLVALATVLSTGSLHAELLGAVLVIAGTFLLGRFFCGWICPLGTLQQIVGYLAGRGLPRARHIALNRPHKGQISRLLVLFLHLAAASGSLLSGLLVGTRLHPLVALCLLALLLLGVLVEFRRGRLAHPGRVLLLIGFFALGWAALAVLPDTGALFSSSLAFGLLDPIPLSHRAVDTLLALLNRAVGIPNALPRSTDLALLTLLIFGLAIGVAAWYPRAFCRYACPLGGLLGLLGRKALFHVGKRHEPCSQCGACEAVCEGACAPSGPMHRSDCLMCMNCLSACPDGVLSFQARDSAAGSAPEAEPGRRAALGVVVAGLCAVPALRLAPLSKRAPASMVRPPGSAPENEFLALCVGCGRCLRVCPTNVLQVGGLVGGFETLFTPVLDFRAGASGCLPHCVACGHACPTGAIRALSAQEKLGQGEYAKVGPLRLGTAFIDRGRCLPWAMERPCVVCQEVCPTSPKAIFTRREPAALGTSLPRVALNLPFVDPSRCIGCGICQHECPVSGEQAIRVSAEGESRNPAMAMVLRPHEGD